MYANVTSGDILPGKLDEFIRIYEESVKPVVEKLAGLDHLYVLTDEQNSRGLIIAIYGGKEDAENANNDGHVQAAIGKLAGTLMIESIQRGNYAVSIKI